MYTVPMAVNMADKLHHLLWSKKKKKKKAYQQAIQINFWNVIVVNV